MLTISIFPIKLTTAFIILLSFFFIKNLLHTSHQLKIRHLGMILLSRNSALELGIFIDIDTFFWKAMILILSKAFTISPSISIKIIV